MALSMGSTIWNSRTTTLRLAVVLLLVGISAGLLRIFALDVLNADEDTGIVGIKHLQNDSNTIHLGGIKSLRHDRPNNGLHEDDRQSICQDAIRDIQELYSITPPSRRKGRVFLYSVGVVLATPFSSSKNDTLLHVQAGQRLEIPIWNCGNCTAYNNCRVSFHARLVGETVIRSAHVRHEGEGVQNKTSGRDYVAYFAAPPVAGAYTLSVRVRWWHGLDDNESVNSPWRSGSVYLGGYGRWNFLNKPEFKRDEKACDLSDVAIKVTMDNLVDADASASTRATTRICTRKDLNGPGYWEWTNTSSLCPSIDGVRNETLHPAECWILDRVNPDWLWRGDSCRYKFFSPDQVRQCLRNTSIVIHGDSIPAEVLANIKDFVPDLAGTRVFATDSQYFGEEKTDRDAISQQIETGQVFVVSDFRVAHLVYHEPLSYVAATTIPTLEHRWRDYSVYQNKSRAVSGLFWTGYPAHALREPHITHDRIVRANEMLSDATTNLLGWKTFDTSIPTWSRPDASWDGFHFLQVRDKVGGASKMLTMMLLNYVCNDDSDEEI